ncbi:hypothetical protein MCOR02_011129 [Pyricularia oryzae]|nr:hypothetical protein MCOR02_011129 [Pyricularia oryzae]KAI6262825.1 hypothetical protein MCOR19_000993 [Pyricularia oryzae]KAI6282723.1 hypothetical protein MCOR26_002682 [Pyricularia oryzae]KAI6320769.1 hypothetical protein MCOR29_005136 [Pyricularia oryzae]KAI6345198.1 hypothetical protein MCOR30_000918 [Pyricularia oryzae]
MEEVSPTDGHSEHQATTHDAATAVPVRPYRSHKVPACDRCRARKLRCTVDIKDKPCLLCRLHSAECVRRGPSALQQSVGATGDGPGQQQQFNYGKSATGHSIAANSGTRRRSGSRSPKRRRTNADDHAYHHRRSSAPGTRHDSPVDDTAPHDRPFAMVGPESAEDLHVIEQYISVQQRTATGSGSGTPGEPSNGEATGNRKRLFNLVSSDPSNPVVSLNVPRYRAGYVVARVPGKTQLEILEQILGPLKDELIEVYFRKNHPAFPILDETAFLAAKERDSMQMISPTLLCYVYATSLIFWRSSPILRKHPRPDITYALNQSVSALQEDFHAASLSTVYAALLDLNGRPTTAVTYNTMLNGRVVAMAHLLGLNRDPERWDLSDQDKKLRARLWWGVLIHDRWSSFAYGVPPSIAQSQYDVPLPDKAVLSTPGVGPDRERDRAAEGFIALCGLTEILGDILPLLHDLRRKTVNTSRRRRDLESDLEEWESNLPEFLKEGGKKAGGNGRSPVSGSSSLWLGYLAVKMLLCRINLREASRSSQSIESEEKDYHLSKLRRVAEATVDFVCSLSEENLLSEFWWPYTAYHLSSVTFLLLRCAIESTDPGASASCRSYVERLRARLYEAREQSGWDLGDICLAQSEESVTKVVTASHTGTEAVGGSVMGIELPPSTVLPIPDADGEIMFQGDVMGGQVGVFPHQNNYNTIDPLGYPWADLWDMFNADGSVIN